MILRVDLKEREVEHDHDDGLPIGDFISGAARVDIEQLEKKSHE